MFYTEVLICFREVCTLIYLVVHQILPVKLIRSVILNRAVLLTLSWHFDDAFQTGVGLYGEMCKVT